MLYHLNRFLPLPTQLMAIITVLPKLSLLIRVIPLWTKLHLCFAKMLTRDCPVQDRQLEPAVPEPKF